MTFVDASAMVGILNRESDADELAARLDAADDTFTSPLAIYEATLGVWRRNNGTIAESRQDVMDLILRAGSHSGLCSSGASAISSGANAHSF